MSIRIRPFSALARDTTRQLEEGLSQYYQNPPHDYYLIADRSATQYTSTLQPFHCDLVSHVRPGMTILEVGCGSAHLCPFVESNGALYTGIDHSSRLLEDNRLRFPNARFFSVGEKLPETFDIVASLYTIEHVVDPQSYMQKIWDFCRPGGLVALICPDFVDGDGFPPSLYHGATPRRFRDKVASLALRDAVKHLLDLLWFAPRWKRRARSSAPGAFWINLAPRVLAGAPYRIDADAVHLPRLQDLIWWFEERAAKIEETSLSLTVPDKAILNHNCYLLARKPA